MVLLGCEFILAGGRAGLRLAGRSGDRRGQGIRRGGTRGEIVLPRESTIFVRLHADEFGDPLALQTATVKYVLRDADGQVKTELFLESVIHIAESSYFRSLNKRFEHYDAVLYELVARPEDNRPAPDRKRPNPVSKRGAIICCEWCRKSPPKRWASCIRSMWLTTVPAT